MGSRNQRLAGGQVGIWEGDEVSILLDDKRISVLRRDKAGVVDCACRSGSLWSVLRQVEVYKEEVPGAFPVRYSTVSEH